MYEKNQALGIGKDATSEEAEKWGKPVGNRSGLSTVQTKFSPA